MVLNILCTHNYHYCCYIYYRLHNYKYINPIKAIKNLSFEDDTDDTTTTTKHNDDTQRNKIKQFVSF